MNLSGLIFWSATVIAGLTGMYNMEGIQRAIWRAQARILYESRTETWGSPRFLEIKLQDNGKTNSKSLKR
ncbi:MAG: hypothetical protein OM95_15640 [Bdellovibrio sp. ArHS]|nr:MAG: hypothetical protein OM95_15640 [Bdellovibrio sp. ArHS]